MTYLGNGVALSAASAPQWREHPEKGLLWGYLNSVWREWAQLLVVTWQRDWEEWERGVVWEVRRGIRGIWDEKVGGGTLERRRRRVDPGSE